MYLFSQSARRDSNPRPRPWQGRAPPTEPLAHKLLCRLCLPDTFDIIQRRRAFVNAFFYIFEKLEQFIILRRFHDPNCHVARGGSYNVIISMRRLKMSAKTKIVVLHMKELIYTLIFAGLGILLIFLLLFMFLPGKEDGESVETMRYVAGVYTSSIQFGEHAVDMQVIVDENRIQSVSMVNLDETVETMYPLMEPALENIADQVVEKQTTEGITYSADYQYTSVVLLNAIENALAKAELSGAEMGE